ncbi:MAG: hypothetical protein WEB63_07665 [Cucumibacter sp.]
MDIFVKLLLWLHLAALGIAVGGGVALGFVGPAMAKATPEQRPALAPIRRRIADSVTLGLLTLIITGPLILWLKFGGTEGMTWWFWAKMTLVLVLLGLNLRSRVLLKKAEGGDMAAGKALGQTGLVGGLVVFLVILAAVFAFN